MGVRAALIAWNEGGNLVLETELKVDTYRLAVLPIAYLGERPDPFDCCRRNGTIDESYRSVFSTGLWLYALYNYLLLVRGKLGDKAADIVWAYQQRILSGGAGEVEAQIGRVFDLIRDAARVFTLQPATDVAVSQSPLELNIALTLLRNLPESPGYTDGARDQGARVDYFRGADVSRRFATCLSGCRDDIVRVFSTTFSSAGPRLQ